MIVGSNQANNGSIEKYCYNNISGNCDTYGGLYEWNEMMQYTTTEGVQGICPDGWHIPTNVEWCLLEQYLDEVTIICDPPATNYSGGIDAGGHLKMSGTSYWNSPNTGATNSSGFTAMPGGNGGYETYGNLGQRGYFWTSTEYNSTSAYLKFLIFFNVYVSYGMGLKSSGGHSVRCIKN